jgi:hypothetical protein
VKLLPFCVRITRSSGGAIGSRRGKALVRLAVTGLTAIGLSQILPLPAAFGQSYYYGGTLTATISLFQPVRSIVLNTSSLVFTACQDAPAGGNATTGITRTGNGACWAGPVTVITSGNVSSSVDVNGADATPDTGGGTWSLTSNPSPAIDQYRMFSFSSAFTPVLPTTAPSAVVTLSNTPAPDTQFLGTGTNVPYGTSVAEPFWLTGPSSTTNSGGTYYSTTIAWTVF